MLAIKRSTSNVPTIEIPDHQRNGSGDHSPENDQQQDRQRRERDQLGVREIAARLVVDFVEARGKASDRRLELVEPRMMPRSSALRP